MGTSCSVFHSITYYPICMTEAGNAIVLLCDDDDFTSRLFTEELQREHFDVVCEWSGEAAQEKIYTSKPDVVILDFILPDKTGYEILEHIHRHDQHLFYTIPFIVFVSFSEEGQVCSAHTLDVIEFVVKSKTTPKDLTEIVRKVLRRTTSNQNTN